MKFIHNYGTDAAFIEEYIGSGYTEPWVSYVQENDNVAYNKVSGYFRVPQYLSGYYDCSSEERMFFEHFFEVFHVEGFDPATSQTGTTFEVKLAGDAEIYFVGGVVPDFDPEDEETWYGKAVDLSNITFYYGNPTDSQYYIDEGITGVIHYEYSYVRPSWDTYHDPDNERRTGYFAFSYDFNRKQMNWTCYQL